MHTRKKSAERADDAVLGSRAFTGIVRCMWHVRRDRNDPERRLLLPGKNNAMKAIEGLAYTVIDHDGTGKVQWEDAPVPMTADEAVKQEKGGGDEDTQPLLREVVAEWLEKVLGAGPRPVGNHNNPASQPGTLVEEARAAGFSWPTVQRSAAQIGVMRARTPNGTMWLLPSLSE